jgi:3-deoxy-D-manno-octulosonate 8-phosphate phosphatase (KDO 8-P phosphatase)
MSHNETIDFSAIKWLVLDVDGVLTDGSILLSADGTESKRFNLLDGHGIRMWKRAQCDVALLSGRESAATQQRADQLSITHVFQGCHFKLPALNGFLQQQAIAPHAVAYVGDDLMDLPCVRHVGFGVAVQNSVDELKAHADYVTSRTGGSGAVREVIEYILKRTDKWDPLMERYLVP